MTTRKEDVMSERERIAQIIDPEAVDADLADQPKLIVRRVVERRRCALAKADAILALPTGVEATGGAVAWRWRNKPDGVWNYQEDRQRIPGVEQQPLFAHPPAVEGPVGAVERLEARISEERDCSVCDGYGKAQRHYPPYGQRDCGGCGATGKILVLDRSLRADIRAILAALSQQASVTSNTGRGG